MIISEMNGRQGVPEGVEKRVKPLNRGKVRFAGKAARVVGAVGMGVVGAMGIDALAKQIKSAEAEGVSWATGWNGWFDNGGATYDCPEGNDFTESGTIKLEGPAGSQAYLQKTWRVVGDPDPNYGNENYHDDLVSSDQNGEVRFSAEGHFDPNHPELTEAHVGINLLDENKNPFHDGIGHDKNCVRKATKTPVPTSTSTEELPTETLTPRATNTPRSTKTKTPTSTPFEITNTFTPTPTDTATPFPTPTDTETPTPTPTGVWVSPTPSNTPEASITPTPSDTPRPSDTPTAVNTPARETQPATQPATGTVGPTRTPGVVSTAVHELAAGGSEKVEGDEIVVKGGLVASVVALLGAGALWIRGKKKK